MLVYEFAAVVFGLWTVVKDPYFSKLNIRIKIKLYIMDKKKELILNMVLMDG